jgi:nicotinate-nucleotide pyrophosphorylase
MAGIALNQNVLDDIQLVAPETRDRLPAMLFLAALVHGILIIGITFNPYSIDDIRDAISLEVTIVADPDQRIDRPDEAEYLAQASQQGGGNTTDEVRPTAPLESASPIDNLGEESGDSLLDASSHEQFADQVLSTKRQQDRKVVDDLREEPQPDSHTAITLESGGEQTLPLPQDEAATLLSHDHDPRQLVISADTRESTIAAYLDNWKRRIEAVGDEYFPELGELDGLTGSPTLEVSIEASGQLSEVILRKSSGSPVLDKAALDILRRASPFDPFPAEVSADYDRLRFAYKWLFSAEDVGNRDITSDLIPAGAHIKATVVTRENMTLAGRAWAKEVFRQVDDSITSNWEFTDGDSVPAKATLFSLHGPARSILTAERTALNFLQLLSATATVTAQYVATVADTACRILDTRKTIPCLRLAQKYAVTCGGGANHRFGLYDAILIKENHILSAGDITKAVKFARQMHPEMPIEVEVESMDEMSEALLAGADRILLDNFLPEKLAEAVALNRAGGSPAAELEASGGVTIDEVRRIATSGVDAISVGALTKNVRAIDLSMRFQ